jgi:uncharacterized protein
MTSTRRRRKMDGTIVARWQEWSGDGLQHLVLRERPDRIVADGVVLATAGGRHFAATYHIECDAGWRATAAQARLIDVDTTIDLVSDGAGRWRHRGGLAVPDLDGAIDVDLSVTPFTNTLPIRRLGLAQGQGADIRAVYLRLPDLRLTIDRQHYTCLNRGRQYRYESLDGRFRPRHRHRRSRPGRDLPRIVQKGSIGLWRSSSLEWMPRSGSGSPPTAPWA